MKAAPMTREEQDFAAEHLPLLYRFLRFHHLPEDDYFDVVVFGYLEAVQRNFRIAVDPERRNFSALAWTCMKSCVLGDWQSKQRVKRKSDLYAVSLDQPLTEQYISDNTFTLHDILPASGSDAAQQVENAELIAQAFSLANENERTVFVLKQAGYSGQEISEILGITVRSVWNSLQDFRAKASVLRENTAPKKTRAEAQRLYRETHRSECRQRSNRKYKARKVTRKSDSEIRENQRRRWREYWAAHKDEINARRKAKRAAEKAASDSASIESGMAQTGRQVKYPATL